MFFTLDVGHAGRLGTLDRVSSIGGISLKFTSMIAMSWEGTICYFE